MDEEVLNDLFERAVSQGYTKSIEDFATLIATDQEVLEDSYSYAVDNGYPKSIYDFSTLVGVKKKRRYGITIGKWFIGAYYTPYAS